MNRYAAPCQSDANHHRNHFEPSKLAAMCVLDRVADGQNVSDRDIQLALEVTGDAQIADCAEIGLRGYARAPRLREGPSWQFDRPSWRREPRPTAKATP